MLKGKTLPSYQNNSHQNIDSRHDEMTTQERDSLLKALLESQQIGNIGIWVFHINQNKLYWSDELYFLLDIPRRKPPSIEEYLRLVHPDDRQKVTEGMAKAMQGEIYRSEQRIMRADGQELVVLSSGGLISDDMGRPLRMVGVVQDITERKRAKKEVQKYQNHLEKLVSERTAELAVAKERAEKANQAKSDFLSNMSHELRTPLNAILGFAELMTRSQYLPPEALQNLGIIRRSGEHLLTLINNVLDLSKIEAGKTTLNPKAFDLYRLLDDLEDMIILKAEKKRLYLNLERAADVPHYIETDEIKLRQVLINLLNNALKFTNSGGVEVRVSYLQEQRLLFEVEDTGVGVSEQEIASLFEAFKQTESGRQSQEGTGLGLPISRQFVQLMGGGMSVRSQVGRGTLFTFDIQINVAEERQVESQTSARRVLALEPNQPRYRILVVDDKSNNRLLLMKLLSPLGFEVREAANGQEAVEIWQAYSPHLIWMDIRMPVMDGYEATKHIKATTKGQATVIIALTASTFEEERAIVLKAGCDDFMRKPFREDELLEMMRKHLEVRYVYEQEVVLAENGAHELKELTSTALATLPAALLRQLEEAALQANMLEIDELIDDIRAIDAQVADGVAELADEFEYEKILTLVEAYFTEA